jgi:hypothetical protein
VSAVLYIGVIVVVLAAIAFAVLPLLRARAM